MYAICPICNQWFVTDPDCDAAVHGWFRRYIMLPSGWEITEDLLQRWANDRLWPSDLPRIMELKDIDRNYIEAEWLVFKSR